MPEQAIRTNPATARQDGLFEFHRGYRVVHSNRKLSLPQPSPEHPGLPEAVLYKCRDAYDGTMALWLMGFEIRSLYDDEYSFGTAYLLSPLFKVGLTTLAH